MPQFFHKISYIHTTNGWKFLLRDFRNNIGCGMCTCCRYLIKFLFPYYSMFYFYVHVLSHLFTYLFTHSFIQEAFTGCLQINSSGRYQLLKSLSSIQNNAWNTTPTTQIFREWMSEWVNNEWMKHLSLASATNLNLNIRETTACSWTHLHSKPECRLEYLEGNSMRSGSEV